MQIIIPMAGNGQRFVDAGYNLPKPLIDVNGAPMIQRVIENLDLDGAYHFIIRSEHDELFGLGQLLKSIVPHSKIIRIDQPTLGAASTALLPMDDIFNLDDELVITNCDQIFYWDRYKFNDICAEFDGVLLCHKANESKWSYCDGPILHSDGDELMRVKRVIEKPDVVPQTEYANVGFYYWKRARDFCYSAEYMIATNSKVNGEFYIAPTYNKLIKDGSRIAATLCRSMHGIGTPEDLEKYVKSQRNLDNP